MITESYNICELITKLIHEANINETVAWFCHWTYDNKMARADKDGALEAAYAYDFRGERIRNATAADETAFLIDNNNQTGYSQALRETGAGGAEKVAYTFGDDLISQDRADAPQGQSALSYLHYDGLGSTRALTSMASMATDTFSYLAFGAILNKTGSTPLAHLFTGEAYDFNLGFYYLRARLYSPITGRFASLDPFSGLNSDPRSLHKYNYANSNPIFYIDPTGLVSLMKLAMGFVIGMILTSLAIGVFGWEREEGCGSGIWIGAAIEADVANQIGPITFPIFGHFLNESVGLANVICAHKGSGGALNWRPVCSLLWACYNLPGGIGAYIGGSINGVFIWGAHDPDSLSGLSLSGIINVTLPAGPGPSGSASRGITGEERPNVIVGGVGVGAGTHAGEQICYTWKLGCVWIPPLVGKLFDRPTKYCKCLRGGGCVSQFSESLASVDAYHALEKWKNR